MINEILRDFIEICSNDRDIGQYVNIIESTLNNLHTYSPQFEQAYKSNDDPLIFSAVSPCLTFTKPLTFFSAKFLAI